MCLLRASRGIKYLFAVDTCCRDASGYGNKRLPCGTNRAVSAIVSGCIGGIGVTRGNYGYEAERVGVVSH